MKTLTKNVLSIILMIIIVLNYTSLSFASGLKDEFVDEIVVAEEDGSLSTVKLLADDGHSYEVINNKSDKVIKIINDSKNINVYEDNKLVDTIFIEEYNNTSLKKFWTKCNYSNTQKGHKGLYVGIDAGTVTAIIMSIIGAGAVSSWAAGVATTIVSDQITDIWFIKDNYYRFDYNVNTMKGKSETTLYRRNDYTGVISSTTTYVPVTSMDNGR